MMKIAAKSPSQSQPVTAIFKRRYKLRELLKTDEAGALYRQRKTIVEPVFGQIKQGRGIREFRLRGFEKTKAEWKLICLTHNLLKLYRHDWLPKRASRAA